MDGNIHVFAGPSLPASTRPEEGCFEWHPPAGAGDLMAFASCAPARLCLIDGFFDSHPAPWHKELLMLMAGGTAVFGAASMGALRAAELGSFGMVGVGAIYRAYRDGRLQGDDEVALIHGPASLGWAPLTVPMVEVRATIAAACKARLIDGSTARRLRSLLHDIHYEDRDWPMMQKACDESQLLDVGTFALIQQLYVPLKQIDALACLDAARRGLAPMVTPPQPPRTCFIEALRSAVLHPG